MRAMRRELPATRLFARSFRVAAGALLLCACGAAPPAVSPPSPALASVARPPTTTDARGAASPAVIEGEWVVAGVPKLRELTVVVKVSPPAELQVKYRELARRYRALATMFTAAASEGFGSGFLMVRRATGARPAETFVVTNRHVVGLASNATVAFDGGRTAPAAVAYVDDRYDLAILSLGDHRVDGRQLDGAALDLTPVRDQDAVVASGYPGIDGSPSYQVTRGYVSNERFVLDGEAYVQHTAAIDPGSSGGPLLSPSGRVLGVNTLKIRGREAVGMAVPATAIRFALEKVLATSEPSDASPDQHARAACEALVSSFGNQQVRLGGLELQLGSRLVAADGVASLSSLPSEDTDWRGLLLHDPTGVLLRALAFRLRGIQPDGSTGERCKRVDPAPPGAPSFLVRLAGAERRFTFGLEQSRWKLVEASLPPGKARSFLDTDAGPPKKWTPRLK